MSFVAVIEIRFQSQSFKSSYSTNPENKFLPQPVFIISTIKVMRNCPVFSYIIIKICVKKNKSDFSYHSFPDTNSDCSSGPSQTDSKMIPLRIFYRVDWKTRELFSFID